MTPSLRRLLALFVGIAALLVACQTSEHPAPVVGSTYRIADDKQERESELLLDVLTTQEECARAKIDDIERCRPRVDRATGEVHLSFVLREPVSTNIFPIPLAEDQILVSHDKARQSDYELVPHDPRTAGQIYFVIIDGSSSMYDNDGERVKKVYRALMSKQVVNAFFPAGDRKTGVVLMQFTDKLRPLGGGEPKVIRSPKKYRETIKNHLLVRSGGFTHLYGAVRTGMTELIRHENIKRHMTGQARATYIVLTDGFNNEAASDTCGTNVSRLTETLEVVKKARQGQGGTTVKPVLYTVGLGKRYRDATKPDGLNQSVTPSALCGPYVDERIDNNLEVFGIDQISLAWLAEAGGGRSFVKQKPRGLAQVFLEAAAKSYRWFEVTYRVPNPIYHRKSFEVGLRLQQGYRSRTTVMLHPNPWFDGPSGTTKPGDRWASLTSLNHALTVLMPLLGLLVFLNYIGAASFNARRAIFRRAKPRRRK